MGFNNEGLYPAAGRLVRRPKGLVVGNIGKNKIHPTTKRRKITCMRGRIARPRDYFVNVSSPNMPGPESCRRKSPCRSYSALWWREP